MKKPSNRWRLEGLDIANGRDGGIRTRDPLHPMQVRYQAALRPDEALHYRQVLCGCGRRRETNQIQTCAAFNEAMFSNKGPGA